MKDKIEQILNNNYKYNIDDPDYFEEFVERITQELIELFEGEIDNFKWRNDENWSDGMDFLQERYDCYKSHNEDLDQLKARIKE